MSNTLTLTTPPSRRNFHDFLTAYEEYAADDFCPPQFHRWAGLSLIAGALERRVWLPWSDTFSYYPNIYVMLVSMPGDGKSVALNKAVRLLIEANAKTGNLNVMPNQVTQAKFIELMSRGRSFRRGTVVYTQNAGYYWASEASNCVTNLYGDFLACITEFYDCPDSFKRSTKKDGDIVLENVCLNFIAGTTFDYLGTLINDQNIMGGLASRFTYIVSRNKEVREQAFQLGGYTDAERAERASYRKALLEDLINITKVVGPMTASPEFARAWEAWWPVTERKRRAIQSEKAQSVMARTNPLALKVAMLLSVADSCELRLDLRHWERALEYVNAVQAETLDIFRIARANSSNPNGNKLDQVANLLLINLKRSPGITAEALITRLSVHHQKQLLEQSLDALMKNDLIRVVAAHAGKGRVLELRGNPDDYL